MNGPERGGHVPRSIIHFWFDPGLAIDLRVTWYRLQSLSGL